MQFVPFRTKWMYNRYDDSYRFVQVSPKVYRLEGDLKHFRECADSYGEIIFIDPSGGPYMEVNKFVVANRTVKKIWHDDDACCYMMEVE